MNIVKRGIKHYLCTVLLSLVVIGGESARQCTFDKHMNVMKNLNSTSIYI